MTTSTFGLLDAILVSDLPPVWDSHPALGERLRTHARRLRHERAFERALRAAGPDERTDLVALSRRD